MKYNYKNDTSNKTILPSMTYSRLILRQQDITHSTNLMKIKKNEIRGIEVRMLLCKNLLFLDIHLKPVRSPP